MTKKNLVAAVVGLALAVTALVGATAGTQRLVAAGGYHVMGVGGSTTCADMTRNLSATANHGARSTRTTRTYL